jgi:PEP-CTERM motif
MGRNCAERIVCAAVPFSDAIAILTKLLFLSTKAPDLLLLGDVMALLRKTFLLFVGVILYAVPATAAIIVVNASGTFGSNTNNGTPLFVPANTPFSINFTYDSDTLGAPDNSGSLTRYTFPDGASLTIGGVVTTGGFTLEAININGSGLLAGLFDLGPGALPGQVRGLTLLSEFAPGAIVGQSLPDDIAFFSRYSFSAQAYETIVDPAPGTDPLVAISFSDQPMIVSATTPAVPEPGTWLMLLAGFGVVGAFLRRRPIVATVSP